MKKKINVLVLGVGGNVSQGILKALSKIKLPVHVVGGCIDPYSAGLYTTDKAVITPLADDPSFIPWLIETCITENIQVILSGTEPVLKVLSVNKEEIYRRSGAVPVVCDSQVLSITNDKLMTCKWLEQNRFNYPRYAASEDHLVIQKLKKYCTYPLIAKPRIGKGSQGIFLINSDSDLTKLQTLEGYVIQEYVGTPETEYTVGCFCDRYHRVRQSLIFRRKLLQGTTYVAEIEDSKPIRDEAIRIVEKLRPMGPCNVQMRISASGRPVCFEINARFSGTTPIRAHFGFNDVELSLRHFVLNEDITDTAIPVKEGIALRYWNEIYINSECFNKLQETGKLDKPRQCKNFVEQYGMKK
jgi:carbamoyl-phosphate synthase large subunit